MYRISKNVFVAIAVILYLSFGILSIQLVTNWLSANYYKTLSEKALDIANLISSAYTISDQEIIELHKLEFREVLNHPANLRLQKLFNHNKFSADIKYAYIITALKPEEIKYNVDTTNQDFFDAPIGTPLNLLWLVDVIVNVNEENKVINDKNYYDDIHRYSFMRDNDIEIYNQREPAYTRSVDEYGDAFTGFAPIYSSEGNFVGMLGIDIYYEKFAKQASNIRLVLSLLFILPSMLLTAVYLLSYLRNFIGENATIHTDPLTSLKNRRYLDYQLPKVIQNHYKDKQSLSVIMIDVDLFKNYNDHYGHQQGDSVLIKISLAIKSVLRHNSDIVCRYGGEEILVILPNTGKSGALIVAGKIQQAVEKLSIPHNFSDAAKHITISQGVYSAVPKTNSKALGSDYIEKADQALYQAKANGRNRFIFYEEHNRLASETIKSLLDN